MYLALQIVLPVDSCKMASSVWYAELLREGADSAHGPYQCGTPSGL